MEASGTADAAQLTNYVDVHCHLIHEQFEGDEDAAAERAAAKGLEFCIVNGLEPESNRKVLELCSRHSNLVAAAGIYPIDACCNVIEPTAWEHEFPPPDKFDVDAEIEWIDQQAAEGNIVAVGECGLDRFYVTDEASWAEQERVLVRLIGVAKRRDLPLILHTRKGEQRTFELLQEHGVTKADFHCYGGKVKLAKRIAEAGYYFSIPSAVERNENFRSLVRALPMELILTETDSPYMGPDRGERNEPATVPRGVAAIAEVKGLGVEETTAQIRDNFKRLFNF
eukprot:CAMPEP_0206398964 /NCGR_PEP_ID=MMETSP0294-20121207/24502_1 /ASSEMBLY_ACC=CAM_ASM_000327 /TAXON_ID=39354 /ORGANISM="Heterosigma akashiwo, Strain CCMP2393" /LENGTH=281 /DNA_ID=CAMNT_0053854603 /DNA_START=144 /DNA_END=989 /DNA_ORIENTATION=+